MKNEFNIYLLAKYYNNECSADEKLFIENWIAKNEENKKLFNSYKAIWDKSGKIPEMFKPDTEITWKNVKSRISSGKTLQIHKKGNIFLFLKIAAVIVIILGSAIFYLTNNRNIVIATSSDQREVKLPDGTSVYMNRNSTLTYPARFRKDNRSIEFEGKGFFNVTKDIQRQFIIQSENTTTTVLGTQFNLEVKSNESYVKVNVVEGKVKFSSRLDETKKVILTAGEEGIYKLKDDKIKEQKYKDENFLSWKTKKYIFNETRLTEILDLLSEDYIVTYKIENQSLRNLKLTATFNNLSIEEIVESIEIALNIEIKVNGNKLIIK